MDKLKKRVELILLAVVIGGMIWNLYMGEIINSQGEQIDVLKERIFQHESTKHSHASQTTILKKTINTTKKTLVQNS